MISHSKFDLGKSLRKAQADKRVSNVQLAQEFQVSAVQIARWRNAQDWKFGRAVAVADFFKMPLQSFAELGA